MVNAGVVVGLSDESLEIKVESDQKWRPKSPGPSSEERVREDTR